MKKTLLILLFVQFTYFINAQEIPRPEYPRPQFERTNWINLNGQWTYEFDHGKSGYARGNDTSHGFSNTIMVPFCPESKLSGVENKDFIEAMWYHRIINVPEAWKGKQIILHFGAVDYQSEVIINGKIVGKHFGGTSSFSYNITKFIDFNSDNHLVVYVKDELRSLNQPGGKQCREFKSRGCYYTRTTGIWQTVWLEALDKCGLKSCNIIPDLDNKQFIFNPLFYNIEKGQKFKVIVKEGKKVVGTTEIYASQGTPCMINIPKPKLWSPESPFLYDIEFLVLDKDKNILDKVSAYAGLRKIHIEGNKVYLNNEPFFMRFVLDQGFYSDGIWTAPSDEALKHDIELSMKAGFNGARLHQKVFEDRFHYWADKLGYLTWAESSSWGLDVNDPEAARNFISEWEEIVVQKRNHPSILAWTPFNETWGRAKNSRQHDRLLSDVYDLTKNLDPTRPINETSGLYHVKTDLYTAHCYEQNPDTLEKMLTKNLEYDVWIHAPEKQVEYAGQPYIMAEYGGIKWIPGQAFADNSWGYGKDPTTLEEFYERLEGLTDVLLNLDNFAGYCYTQLTDIEQEQNGIYNYDRTEKFDMKIIRKIFSKVPAKYEK